MGTVEPILVVHGVEGAVVRHDFGRGRGRGREGGARRRGRRWGGGEEGGGGEAREMRRREGEGKGGRMGRRRWEGREEGRGSSDLHTQKYFWSDEHVFELTCLVLKETEVW